MLDTTRDRIKREAMRLFVAHGIDAVSMRDIADAAGLKAPSLYAHFRSREDLIADLFLASYAEYGRRLQAAATADETFHHQLAAMVREACALHHQDELLFNFLLITQHGTLRYVSDLDSNPVEVICRLIARAMANGDIQGGNATLIAAAIIGVIVQAATFKLYNRSDQGLLQQQDELVALCLRIVS